VRIGIFGAGAIGSFVGGRLALAGASVSFIGRAREKTEKHGLTVIDLDGVPQLVPKSSWTYHDAARDLGACDTVIVTVKSHATAEAGEELAPFTSEGALVVSLQNGLSNAGTLKRALPGCDVRAAMIPYNVVWEDNMVFRRSTSGAIALEQAQSTVALADLLVRAGLACELRKNIRGVLGTKLLFNLNNAINALSGVPLAQEIADRDYRRVYAAAMREGARVLRAEGIKLERSGGLIPGVAPFVLEMPDPIFRRVAARMIRVNPEAKSSMLGDLDRGKKTENDHLCGEIVTLGAKHGILTPVNGVLCQLIAGAETEGRSPKMQGRDVWARIQTTR